MPLVLALALAAAAAGPRPPALPGAAPRAAAGAPAGPDAAADPRIVRLRFAWEAPARAKVTFRKTRSGPSGSTTFTSRYESRVEADGAALLVSTHGTSWRGDLPLPRALAAEAIRASEAVVQRVSAGGEFRDLEGVEAMRPIVAQVLADAKVPPEAAERATALALAAMRGEAEEAWNLAVGFWAGADLALGRSYVLETEAEIPLLTGVRAEHAVEFSVRRRVPCGAGERALRCVEARLRAVPDRAALERAAAPLLARLVPPGSAERPEGAAGELSAESELVLVTDPGTLLPRRVVWTKAVRLGAAEDGPARAELVDRSEWDYRHLPPERPRPIRRHAPAAPVPAAAAGSPDADAGAPRGRRPPPSRRRPARGRRYPTEP
jgi:hypothetical protein